MKGGSVALLQQVFLHRSRRAREDLLAMSQVSLANRGNGGALKSSEPFAAVKGYKSLKIGNT
jgi:hypothetical protein